MPGVGVWGGGQNVLTLGRRQDNKNKNLYLIFYNIF